MDGDEYRTMTDEELMAAAAREQTLSPKRPQRLQFALDYVQASVMLGALQLALRHPQFNGRSAEVVRTLAEMLAHGLTLGPATAEMFRRGWPEAAAPADPPVVN